MTRLINTALARKFALLLGAVAISGIALAAPAPAEAKSKFDIDIHIGSGFGFGGGYYGAPCDWYLHKYYVTGKYYWKKKYYKCIW